MRRTWNGLVDLRRLFRAYWILRRDGRFNRNIVDGALQVAMEKDTKQYEKKWVAHGYRFDYATCNCKGAKHSRFCKHKVSARMLSMAESLKEDGDER